MKHSLVIALLAVAGAVFAQDIKPIGLSLKLGLFFPAHSNAQTVGDNWFGFGLDYKLGTLTSGSRDAYRASYSVSVDLFQKGSYRATPILLNYTGETASQFYYLAGAGISSNKKPGHNGVDFAYALGAGYEFSRSRIPTFAEVRWLGNGDSDLSGWTINVGVRF